MRSPRRRRSHWMVVLAAAVILGILVYSLVASWLPQSVSSYLSSFAATAPSSEPGSSTGMPSGGPTLLPGIKPEITQQATLSVTLIGPASSADAWANSLLNQTLDTLKKPAQPGDGFAWWQGSEAIDFLAYGDGEVQFKDNPLSANDQSSITVSIVAQKDPNQLQRVGRIRTESSALVLTVTSSQPDRGDMQWILTGSEPDTALGALVIQAAARSVVLRAAYNPGSGQESGALVLLGAQSAGTPLPTSPTPIGQTPTPSPVPASPTATHAPEQGLGDVIETRLKPVIDAGLSFPPDVVAAYTTGHAWNGSLTWTETGPEVDNRPVNVNQASELTFLILTPNDPRGLAQPFLVADYTGNVTRFPDEQTYFTGQRMNEILYWTVTYAARRGGLLQASYDDFGTRQAITFIGFIPFARSGSQTPGP